MSVQKQNVYHNTQFFGDMWFEISFQKLRFGEIQNSYRHLKHNTLSVNAPIHVI